MPIEWLGQIQNQLSWVIGMPATQATTTQLYCALQNVNRSVTGPFIVNEVNAHAMWHSNCVQYAPAPLRSPLLPNFRQKRQRLRAGRRALRRSIDIYSRVRGADELREFLGGRLVKVKGFSYDFHIRKTTRVLAHTMEPNSGHIPYDLRIAERDKTPVAKGCIIFPGLPLLDQILALTMSVREEDDEKRLVKTTNWSALPGVNSAMAHAMLSGP